MRTHAKGNRLVALYFFIFFIFFAGRSDSAQTLAPSQRVGADSGRRGRACRAYPPGAPLGSLRPHTLVA
jgi:hypothetical protein